MTLFIKDIHNQGLWSRNKVKNQSFVSMELIQERYPQVRIMGLDLDYLKSFRALDMLMLLGKIVNSRNLM